MSAAWSTQAHCEALILTLALAIRAFSSTDGTTNTAAAVALIFRELKDGRSHWTTDQVRGWGYKPGQSADEPAGGTTFAHTATDANRARQILVPATNRHKHREGPQRSRPVLSASIYRRVAFAVLRRRKREMERRDVSNFGGDWPY
jgi:hypothetical protein